jgi:hypothetical protein
MPVTQLRATHTPHRSPRRHNKTSEHPKNTATHSTAQQHTSAADQHIQYTHPPTHRHTHHSTAQQHTHRRTSPVTHTQWHSRITYHTSKANAAQQHDRCPPRPARTAQHPLCTAQQDTSTHRPTPPPHPTPPHLTPPRWPPVLPAKPPQNRKPPFSFNGFTPALKRRLFNGGGVPLNDLVVFRAALSLCGPPQGWGKHAFHSFSARIASCTPSTCRRPRLHPFRQWTYSPGLAKQFLINSTPRRHHRLVKSNLL